MPARQLGCYRCFGEDLHSPSRAPDCRGGPANSGRPGILCQRAGAVADGEEATVSGNRSRSAPTSSRGDGHDRQSRTDQRRGRHRAVGVVAQRARSVGETVLVEGVMKRELRELRIASLVAPLLAAVALVVCAARIIRRSWRVTSWQAGRRSVRAERVRVHRQLAPPRVRGHGR